MERGNDDMDKDFTDSVLCVSGARLVSKGLHTHYFSDKIVKFVNAGGGNIEDVKDLAILIEPDAYFGGGDSIRTEEKISDGGDFSTLYQSARFGNFCYRFINLHPGDYFVDLHFVEIVNTNGPKGIRVFDVFMQEEKVVSELDIYAIVGANKPLQLVDVSVTVGIDGVLKIRFEGIDGGSIVSGICIRETQKLLASEVKQGDYEVFAAEVETMSIKRKSIRTCSIAKYEKKIEELSTQCQLKTNECHQAWMSLTAANEELQKIKMELDNKSFENLCLDQAKATETTKLKNVSSRYEHERQLWAAAINELIKSVKMMKEEHSQLSCQAHECADSVPELNTMAVAVQAMISQCEDYKLKYNEEQTKRKELYNQIQEAKGNIRVFCRCRPSSRAETLAGFATVVDFSAAKDGDLGILTGPSTKKTYRFDRVYTPDDGQVDVFADAQPMVTSVLDGYNVCIFAYGQTGTGKTFTMDGPEHNRGVNYRTLEQLFKLVEERKEVFIYKISVSVLEIYNEQIRDLLSDGPTTKKLEIRQASEGFHYVPGIIEARINNIEEVWNVLQAGTSARAVGSNTVNEHSSRSHCMLCITVGAKNLINDECTQSKLWLVDLAGSERLAKTEVQGDRLKEAQNINRSLSALGDVISALASKSSHIPYRNSKLTHLLQDSLGGNSKTLMFVQVSPSEKDLGETLCSLNFATRARGVELGVARKHVDTSEIQKLKMQVDKAKQDIRSKDESLRNAQVNFQNLDDKLKDRERTIKSQQEKFKELEIQLQFKTESHKQMEKQLLQLSQGIKGKDNHCAILQFKINELEEKIKDSEYEASKAVQYKNAELENQLNTKREHEYQIHALQEKNTELENQMNKRKSEFEHQIQVLQQKNTEVENQMNKKKSEFEYQIQVLQEKNAEVRNQANNVKSEFEHKNSILQEKIMELENCLKLPKSSSESRMVQEKIKELEERLRRKDAVLQNFMPCTSDNSQLIQEKIKELEEKLSLKDAVSQNVLPNSYNSKIIPSDREYPSFSKTTISRDSHSMILKVSNRSESQESALLKKPDSLRESRRKHDSQNRGIENNFLATTPILNKKPISTELNKRQIDPSKAFARVTKSTKPFPNSQRGVPIRQVQGIKERDSSTKSWLR